MPFDQIATGISIISSGLKGYQAISLSDLTATTLSTIASGSAVEVCNSFFRASEAISVNASSWTAIGTSTTAFLALTPSGTAGSQVLSAAWQADEPVWDTSKCGYYASAASTARVVALAYKEGPSSYRNKTLLPNRQGESIKITIPIGDWNMDSTQTVYINHGLDYTKITSFGAVVIDDTALAYYKIEFHGTDNAGHIHGAVINGSIQTSVTRLPGGYFDSASFDSTGYNRGFIKLEYDI